MRCVCVPGTSCGTWEAFGGVGRSKRRPAVAIWPLRAGRWHAPTCTKEMPMSRLDMELSPSILEVTSRDLVQSKADIELRSNHQKTVFVTKCHIAGFFFWVADVVPSLYRHGLQRSVQLDRSRIDMRTIGPHAQGTRAGTPKIGEVRATRVSQGGPLGPSQDFARKPPFPV